ncbi:Uncharacterized protein dnl_30480 [Desulfonema limicola]|uniref:Uncharacterized protein n=1 Tax=Desulfonema limicola TaxID=45656 RepID=A0A975B8W4_9BACT|nr:Uncharacterized protein dnl_30480 [Desulfonema limicola]
MKPKSATVFTEIESAHSCTSMKTRIETIFNCHQGKIQDTSQLYFHENKD